jgi:hypothetical protein
MNRKFLQFTIGAASSLIKKFVPCNNEWFIEYASTTTLTLKTVEAVAINTAVAPNLTTLSNYIITITFTTADATYASHDAVMSALASANGSSSAPTTIIVPVLPLVGSTQQLITSIALA